MIDIPVIAVVGRPNVGKSTLVNRLIGRREAIVEEKSGVTRDRILYTTEWRGRPFVVVDTGGLEAEAGTELAGKVTAVARMAAAEATVIAFVIDVDAGITPEDTAVADELRRLGRPIFVIANKADTTRREREATELYSLGMGEPIPVSALHGRGVGDLLDILTQDFPAEDAEESKEPNIAIVGRPNVGKSTLFNQVVGAERSIVHDEPGTTRDAVDTVVEHDGHVYRFVDTAGLRRSARVDESTEFFGTVRTKRALERCDIAVLVVDATEEPTRQDLRIAEDIAELGRSAIVVLNKIDQLDGETLLKRHKEMARRLPHLRWAPMVDLSAKTGRNVPSLFDALPPVLEARGVRIPTPILNAVIEDMQARTPIPSVGRGERVKYAVQAETSPPTIVLFGASKIPEQWLRYIEKGLRSKFGFEGTPIRFSTRGRNTKGRSKRAG